ncbi:hypothetical protein F5Y12DRAFT_727374 [Xylaria sp. FL1777]|nr:hypothetical protein F5Y12DRAFT_727374 [Xylaria sp. FL1777]
MASQSSDDNQYPVYIGIWTNWSRGQVFGSTLTLEREEANLLIAFTAFFVAFVSTRFWRIACFAFHRHYATADRRDAIYHQRQAILRNSSTPESGIQVLLRLIWTTRRHRNRFHPIFPAVIALICIAAFAVAGGFSSQISTAVGTEVLVNSQNCGYLDRSKINVSEAGAGLDLEVGRDLSQKINSAATYAQQCYSNSTDGTFDCGRYSSKSLQGTIDSNAPCPFEEELCRSSSANLRIDSGFINSHEDLGLNSPPEDRVLTRYVLHCAPINTQNYTSQINTSVGILTAYHYGTQVTPIGTVNYIWTAESLKDQYAAVLAPDAGGPLSHYQVSTEGVKVKNEQVDRLSSTFLPIESMNRKDADLYIFFLSGEGVLHSAPSTDEWYRVSPTPVNSQTANANQSAVVPIYLPLEPASPLVCIQQFQFCHVDAQHCGPLASLSDAADGAASFFSSKTDSNGVIDDGTAGAELFNYTLTAFNNLEYPSFDAASNALGPASLTSQRTLITSIQGPLAPNQWQMDVTYWWDIHMASLQQAFIDIAFVSPQASSVLKYRSNFTSTLSQKLCNSQKIRSTAHASFSLFGLLFAFLLGFLITLTSYLLEPISGLLYRKWGFKGYAHLEWMAQTTLQLQRLAHEELGSGTWSNGTKEIPTTEAGDLLASLDISNPGHPVLRLPHKEDDSSVNKQPIEAVPDETAQNCQHHINPSPSPERIHSEIVRSTPYAEPQFLNHDLDLTPFNSQELQRLSSLRSVSDEVRPNSPPVYDLQEDYGSEPTTLHEASLHSMREPSAAERAYSLIPPDAHDRQNNVATYVATQQRM